MTQPAKEPAAITRRLNRQLKPQLFYDR